MADTQEEIDRFYWTHGEPCCAGCDWWRHFNSVVGECLRSPPVADSERWAMIGITGHSLPTGAGHVATLRDHRCGDFRDSFDWASLPPAYQRRVGVPHPREMKMDPIHRDTAGWWFWDEAWADRLGPYPDEATARARLADYGHFLDTGEDPATTR